MKLKGYVEDKTRIVDFVYKDVVDFLQNNKSEITDSIKKEISFNGMTASNHKCVNEIIKKIIEKYDKESEVILFNTSEKE